MSNPTNRAWANALLGLLLASSLLLLFLRHAAWQIDATVVRLKSNLQKTAYFVGSNSFGQGVRYLDHARALHAAAHLRA